MNAMIGASAIAFCRVNFTSVAIASPPAANTGYATTSAVMLETSLTTSSTSSRTPEPVLAADGGVAEPRADDQVIGTLVYA